MELRNPRPLLAPEGGEMARASTAVCGGGAAPGIHSVQAICLFSQPPSPPASSMWPCPSQTHFLLKREGTPSWQPHVLIWGDAPSCHGTSVLWSWGKSLEVVEPGWPALIPKPGVLGPRKFWLLAILPPHPPVQAQGSRGVLPRTPVFGGAGTYAQETL